MDEIVRRGNLPFAGVRVLEVATIVAGPYAGRILSDFGADVVKVEDPVSGGDPGRHIAPHKNGLSLPFARLNVGKRSIGLNLRGSEGQDLLRRVAGHFDVVIINFRHVTAIKWGLTSERLTAGNPDLIVAEVTGFGRDEEVGGRPGFGTIMDGIAGFAYRNGWPDRPPTTAPFGLADHVAGMAVAFAVASSLFRRSTSGRGADIDVALYEPLLGIMGDSVLRYSALGEVEERAGNFVGAAAPRGVFETADGEWVVVSGSSPNTGRRCVEVIGLEPTDSRWVDNAARVAHQEVLNGHLQQWVAQRTRHEVLSSMEAAGVPAGPVNSGADIVKDPMFRSRGAVVPLGSPELGDAVIPGRMFRLDGMEDPTFGGPPRLGEHTQAVLSGCGVSAAELTDLRANGVIS